MFVLLEYDANQGRLIPIDAGGDLVFGDYVAVACLATDPDDGVTVDIVREGPDEGVGWVGPGEVRLSFCPN